VGVSFPGSILSYAHYLPWHGALLAAAGHAALASSAPRFCARAAVASAPPRCLLPAAHIAPLLPPHYLPAGTPRQVNGGGISMPFLSPNQ